MTFLKRKRETTRKRPYYKKNSVLPLLFALLIFGTAIFVSVCSASGTDSGAMQVTDQRGTSVTIPEKVERIITIPIPAASMIFTLDGNGDRLAGMNPTSMSAIKKGILGKIDPQMLTIETDFIQGGQFEPNVEQVLNLRPDVVIQWAQYGESLYKPLEDAGIPVVCLKYGTQEDLETWIALFGKILHQEERASSLIAYHQDVHTKIKEMTAGIAEKDKPKVLALSHPDQFTTSGEGTYNDYYFDLTGAINVAKDLKGSSNVVSMEQIISWNPDIIYLGNFDDLTPQDLYENKLPGQDWSSISAVKNHQVYKVPLGGYRWDPPNQESPLMWEWLAEIHHPELFSFDLRGDMKDFYRKYYNYDLGEEEIDWILHTDLNQ